MRRVRALSCALAVVAVLAFEGVVVAEGDAFKARLSPVPVESSTLAGITGSGSATATLGARTLSVSGSFQGLQSPATVAQLHLGPKGVRGPVLFMALRRFASTRFWDIGRASVFLSAIGGLLRAKTHGESRPMPLWPP